MKGFSTQMDPTDYFAIAQLEVNKNKRELILVKSGVMGMGTKANDAFKDGVPYNTVAYGRQSIKFTPTQELKPGEYAVQTRLSSQHVFCFGIDPK
jgi:hypothetical protein